jgi:uncharacterized SAM-binding protein YcdF (DUF218 family)
MNTTLFFGIITIAYLSIFLLINHFFGRARLSNGFWFFLLICLIFCTLASYGMESKNGFVITVLVFCVGIIAFLLIFSVFIVIILSLVNGIKLIRREGFSFANSLSLLLGIFLVFFILFNSWMAVSFRGTSGLPDTLSQFFLVLFDLATGYFIILYLNFLFASTFYSIYHPLKAVQYIIILGSGLIHGDTVSPLLAGRINCGIKIYDRQRKRKRNTIVPKMIFSGGQGTDEKLSEARAMKQYALEHGVQESDILIEDQSVNTYQNMFNSKKIIENREGNMKKCRILFCTTNYHVFRSAVYAHQVGLKAQGIGASTKGYYRYNAMLREFIALIKMHWKKYLIKVVLFILLCYMLRFFIVYVSEHSEQMQNFLQSLEKYF